MDCTPNSFCIFFMHDNYIFRLFFCIIFLNFPVLGNVHGKECGLEAKELTPTKTNNQHRESPVPVINAQQSIQNKIYPEITPQIKIIVKDFLSKVGRA